MDCYRRRHHSNVGCLAVVVIVSVSCLLMADMSMANFDRSCTEQQIRYHPNSQGYCGKNLSEAVESACQGIYYGQFIFICIYRPIGLCVQGCRSV